MDGQEGTGRGVQGQGSPESPPPVVTREIAAEAAFWVARLHGPSRSRAMEQECRAWQARSAAHRHAFERCTETWMEVPGVTVAGAYAAADGHAASGAASGDAVPSGLRPVGWLGGLVRPGRRAPVLGLAAVLLASTLAVVWQPWRDVHHYRTGVGELQTVVLRDGTRLSLNTDTRVRVELNAAQRTVSVEGGEALFEVAKDAKRPFVVRAAASEVVALGTVFTVRLATGSPGAVAMLAVTLIEGQVALRPRAGASAAGVAPAQPVLMSPGDRVRLVQTPGRAETTVQQTDRPRLEQVVAWQRSEAVFDNTTLAEAVAEMNRYSRTPIVLMGGVAADGRRISGQYRAGDNVGFAQAVAALHGLTVTEAPGRLELSAGP